MIKIRVALFFILTISLTGVLAVEISEQEKQLELIGYYQLIVHGRDNVSSEALAQMEFSADILPIKCGTPTV